MNRYFQWKSALLRALWWSLLYRQPFRRSYFFKPTYITPRHLTWGKNVMIFKYCRIEGVAAYNHKTFCPSIVLHDNVSIQQNAHITCAEKITIGENTAIASNVTITDIDHPYADIHVPVEGQHLHVTPVSIGPDSKVYNNAVILPGTSLGKHCVVGANSVVKGVFPDYCIIVGAPACIVRRYNTATQQWERTLRDGSFPEEKKD